MMQQEIDACNDLGKARAQAQAEREVTAERKRLDRAVSSLEREKRELAQQLQMARDELEHARAARAAAEEKAATEREAHSVWQAHVDTTLSQCRQRLVGRTEQLYQVTRTQPERGTGEDAAAEGEPEGVVASIAAALQREREGGLCCVCADAPKSVVLMPCKHELCGSCAYAVQEHSGRCPLCLAGVASCADVRLLTCQVCFDEVPALKGIECGAADEGGEAGGEAAGGEAGAPKHFLCDTCLTAHVNSSVEDESMARLEAQRGIVCVCPGCEAPPYTDTALAKALPEEAFARYNFAKQRLAERRINAELERDFNDRLQKLHEKMGASREAIRQRIQEQ